MGISTLCMYASHDSYIPATSFDDTNMLQADIRPIFPLLGVEPFSLCGPPGVQAMLFHIMCIEPAQRGSPAPCVGLPPLDASSMPTVFAAFPTVMSHVGQLRCRLPSTLIQLLRLCSQLTGSVSSFSQPSSQLLAPPLLCMRMKSMT